MNPRQIVALGRKVGRADPGDRRLPDLVIDFVSALAIHVDHKRAPRVTGGTWTLAEAAEIQNLVRIETDYPGDQPVPHEAPSTGSVRDMLRARLSTRARKNFDMFAELIGQHVEGGEVRGMRQSPMHRKWTELRTAHRRVLMICSIDSGKTTQNAVLYPVWCLGRDSNERIALVGNTAARAMDLLRACADLIVSPEVRAVFPWLAPNQAGPWSTTQLQVARTMVGMKEASLSAYGVRGAVQGNRFSKILADDLTDRENTATQALIEDLNGWWSSTVETRLIDGGQVVYCATPWKPNDLTATLEKSGLYKIAKFPLIDPDTGRVSWPEHWTAERIQEKRIALGELDFARFCLCQPRTDEGSAFRETDVKAAIEAGSDFPAVRSLEDLSGGKPEGAEIYVACDPASGSTKRRRDNTAIATIMVEPGNRHTLLYLWSGRAGLEDARKIMAEQNDRWQPKAIAVESGGMQRTWCEELRKDGLPVVEHITSSLNKFDGSIGVESMAVLFQNRQFVVPAHVAESKAGRALVSGLLFYAGRLGHTADELMSLWIAYHAAKSDRRARRRVPVVAVRVIGDGTGPRSFSDSAARDRYYDEQSERAKMMRQKLTDVPDLTEDQEADAREAARNARHAGILG